MVSASGQVVAAVVGLVPVGAIATAPGAATLTLVKISVDIRNQNDLGIGDVVSVVGNGVAFVGGIIALGFSAPTLGLILSLTGVALGLGGTGVGNLTVGQAFTRAKNWVWPSDPIILDLDGDGLETVGLASNIYFDHDGDGVLTRTGWTGKDDALLVWDRNANGTIDTGAELFGDFTRLPNGALAPNGFSALAALDTNGDGILDANDPAFAELKLWRDSSQDGKTGTGELISLADAGIVSLDLANLVKNQGLSNGNTLARQGSFTWANGTVGSMGEFRLATDTFNTQFAQDIAIPDALKNLPTINGSGNVRELRQAAALSEQTATLLGQYQVAGTRTEQKAMLDQLITSWADTSGMGKSLNERAGNRYRVLEPANSDLQRKLHALEAFNGQYFFNLPDEKQQTASANFGLQISYGYYYYVQDQYGRWITAWQPNNPPHVSIAISAAQRQLIDQAYEALKESVYAGLVLQTRLKPYLDAVELVIDDSGVHLDASALSQKLADKKATDPENYLADLLDLDRYASRFLAGTNWDGMADFDEMVRTLPQTSVIAALLNEFHVRTLGDGEDTPSLTSDSDIVLAGDGKDRLYGGAGNDRLYGQGGDDLIMGGNGDDLLSGGAGNDVLYGESGVDTYVFRRGSGNDVIVDHAESGVRRDIVRFVGLRPEDFRVSADNDENLVFTVVDTGDTLTVPRYSYWYGENGTGQYVFDDGTAWSHDDALRASVAPGTDANDTIFGSSTSDTMVGKSGDDLLVGSGGDDIVEGGAGNDTLVGTTGWTWLEENGSYRLVRDTASQVAANGNDTYVFGRGDGQDTIIDGDWTQGNSDRLRFKEGITLNDLKFTRDGADLILSIRNSTDKVTISGYFDEPWYGGSSAYLIERITLADGTALSFADVQAKLFAGNEDSEIMAGSRADDILTGQEGDDVVLGGAGHDILDGGAGNDVLRGGGYLGWQKQIYEVGGAGDTYRFGRGDGHDTIIEDSWKPGEVDRIEFKEGVTAADVRLEHIRTINGWQVSDDLKITIRDTGETLIVKNHFNASNRHAVEEIAFADGTVLDMESIKSRVLLGEDGDDPLRGYADRDDFIQGAGGDDALVGLSGDDTLEGGTGNDNLDAGAGDDSLSGGAGNDVLKGGYGSDTYRWGMGNGQDVIDESYDASTDVLELDAGIAAEDLTVRWTTNGDMTVTLPDGSRVLVRGQAYPWYNELGIEQVRFADGTVWDRNALATRALSATAGDDSIVGGYANDTLDGGAGNDHFSNIGDYDTYRFGLGDGNDTIESTSGALQFKTGINQNDVNFSRDGDDLIVSLVNSTDSVRLKNWIGSWWRRIEDFKFDNGAHLSAGDVLTKLSLGDQEEVLFGSPDADVLDGTEKNTESYGREGNDVLSGGAGSDYLYGEQGNDVLLGNADSDNLEGGDGDDTLDGGSGRDTLYGSEGNNTYLITQGMELDTVYAADKSVANDTIVFAAGIRPQDVVIQLGESSSSWDVQPGDVGYTNLVIGIGGNDALVIRNNGGGDLGRGAVQHFRFADGTEWSLADVIAHADEGFHGWRQRNTDDPTTVVGSAGDDEIYDYTGQSLTVQMRANNDNVNVGAGNDQISAGSGDDNVAAGGGDNIVAGEAGSDYLSASEGNDVFVFNYGDGQDTVRFEDGMDTLSLGGGISVDMLSAKKDADGQLVLVIDGGAGGELVLDGTSLLDLSGDLERIQFVAADGSTRVFNFEQWLRSNAAALIAADIDQPTIFDGAGYELTGTVVPAGSLEAIAYAQTGDLLGTAVLEHNSATEGSDVLYGTNVSDTIDAGGGNDIALGLADNDTIDGGDGNDMIQGGDGDDVLDGNAGDDVLYGGWGADQLTGGTGNDQLFGEWGGDTYVYQPGHGEVIIDDDHREINSGYGGEMPGLAAMASGYGGEWDGGEGGYGGTIIDDAPNILTFGPGIRPQDLRYSEQNGDLVIEFANQPGDRVILRGYEPSRATQTRSVDIIRFADGTEIVAESIQPTGQTVIGDDEGGWLGGTAFADTLIGGDGDDELDGQGGADKLVGGSGSDTYRVTKEWNSGPTEVVIAETWRAQDFNRVEINGDINPQDLQLEFDGSDLLLRFTAQGDAIRFAGFDPRQEGMGMPVDQVVLPWQDVTLSIADLIGRGIRIIGTEQDDVLVGTALADWIEGRESDDTLVGGAGGDLYVVEDGDGIDTIIDVESGDAPNTLVLPAGTNLDDVRLSYDGEGFLILSFANIDNRIRLAGFDSEDPLGPHAVKRFRFGLEGDEIGYADLIARGFDIVGTEGNDALRGTILTDRIQGGNGNDLMEATAGGDLLSGQGGNDVYVVNLGNGIVTIDDLAEEQAGNVLRFGEGISQDALRNNLRFESDGSGGHVLLIPYGNDGDVVRLMGFNPTDVLGGHAVDRFEFADGSSVDYATLVSWTFVVEGDSTDNGLTGTNVADRLYGYDGNDVLEAGSGDDVLTGGVGNDVLSGGDGRDNYVANLGDGQDTVIDSVGNVLVFGEGINRDDVHVQVIGDNLTIQYGVLGDSINVLNYAPDGTAAGTVIDTFIFNDGSTTTLRELMNNAPELAHAVENQLVLEDHAFQLQLPAGMFTDADGDAVLASVSLAGFEVLPDWLHYDAATQTLYGTPSNMDVGSIDVVVQGSDAFGGVTVHRFTVTVQNVNDAPQSGTPMSDVAATEDETFSFSIPLDSFSDEDVGDQLSFTATLANGEPLPSWLDFDAATGIFSGVPGNADVGSLQVLVTTTDVAGAQASQTFQLSVANTNDAPETGSTVSGQQAAQDATFNFTVPADAFIDVDAGDTLVVTATLDDGAALPDWLRFDAQTQTFSGIPSNSDVGSLQVRVTATDRDGVQVSQTFALDVANVNDAPVVGSTLLSQHAIEDTAFSYTLAADSFQDIDAGDALSFNATLENGDPLPSWLSFDPATQTFWGTPSNGDVGAVQVRVTATDLAGGSATQVFALTIANTNDAPTAQIPLGSQSTAEDTAFVYALPANAFTDVDAGDRLTYSATLSNGEPLPAWLTLDAQTGVFTGTPDNSDVGMLQIRVIATDASGAQASQSLDLAVTNTNDAPEVAIVIGGQLASEDQAFSFTLPTGAFRDVDANDPLTLSATLADGSALPTWLRFDAQTGTFSGIPTNGDVATLLVRVTATDQAGVTAMQLFSVGVNNTNDAPELGRTLSGQLATEDAAFVFTPPQDSFRDVDAGDTLALTATMPDGTALPSWLHFDAATRTFSGTPLNGDVGSFAVRLTATDTAGASVTQTVAFTIANVNDAPTVSVAVGSMEATEDASFVFTVPQTSFSDIDAGDFLTLSASLPNGAVLPSWLRFDAATRTFSGTPSNGDVGNVSVLLTATDTSGAQVSQTIALSVVNVNDAPTVGTVIANQTGRAGTAFSWQLPGTAFVDMDANEVLTYSAHLADGSALPAWLQIDPTTGAFTGTPPSAGTYAVQVTATDRDGAQVSQIFTATIDAATGNQAPVTEADGATVAEDSKLLAWGNVLTNDQDPEGKRLSVADAGVRRGAYGVLTLLSNGTYAYVLDNCSTSVQRLGAGETVTDTFAYTANDGTQRSTGVLTITVQGSNDAPDLMRCLSDVQLAKGKSFTWTVPAGSFVDADRNDKLSYVASLSNGGALPSWLKFDATTQTFSGTAPANAKGSIDVRVTASDGHGDCSTASDVFKISFGNKTIISHGNEGVGNGDDAPPPGHDYNHNDGQGTFPGHHGDKGGKGRNDDDAFQRFLDGFKSDDKKTSSGYPALDRRWLEDCLGNQRPEEAGYGRENHDVERHWNALTHALNRMDAERQSTPSWSHANQGADVSGLAGMLHGNDSQRRGGADPISLACSSGTQLKGFAGIKEGVGRLPW